VLACPESAWGQGWHPSLEPSKSATPGWSSTVWSLHVETRHLTGTCGRPSRPACESGRRIESGRARVAVRASGEALVTKKTNESCSTLMISDVYTLVKELYDRQIGQIIWDDSRWFLSICVAHALCQNFLSCLDANYLCRPTALAWNTGAVFTPGARRHQGIKASRHQGSGSRHQDVEAEQEATIRSNWSSTLFNT